MLSYLGNFRNSFSFYRSKTEFSQNVPILKNPFLNFFAKFKFKLAYGNFLEVTRRDLYYGSKKIHLKGKFWKNFAIFKEKYRQIFVGTLILPKKGYKWANIGLKCMRNLIFWKSFFDNLTSLEIKIKSFGQN